MTLILFFSCIIIAILHHILLSNFVYAPEKYRKVTDNPWFYVWVSDCVIFSIYAYAWDVRQDFDLWDCKAQVNTKCLRDELIYESKVSKQTLSIYLLFISMRKIAWLNFLLLWLCESFRKSKSTHTQKKLWYFS